MEAKNEFEVKLCFFFLADPQMGWTWGKFYTEFK